MSPGTKNFGTKCWFIGPMKRYLGMGKGTMEPLVDLVLWVQWTNMEWMQEKYPYFWWGWDGFVPFVYLV